MTAFLSILAIQCDWEKQRESFVRSTLSYSPYIFEFGRIERTVNGGIDVYCTIVNMSALRSNNAWMLNGV